MDIRYMRMIVKDDCVPRGLFRYDFRGRVVGDCSESVNEEVLVLKKERQPIHTMIEKYREAARRHGEATERGDDKVANKTAEVIAAAHREIVSCGEAASDALLALLDDVEPGVRLWAAADLLDRYPDKAVPVLAELVSTTRLIGMSAQQTLKEWRGRLVISRGEE